MSYSVEPHELLGLAERMRVLFDDAHDLVTALQRSTDATARSLARAKPLPAAFRHVAEPRVDLGRRIIARGRTAVSALQTAALAYLTADDEMAAATDARSATSGAAEGNPFDSAAFGRRRR